MTLATEIRVRFLHPDGKVTDGRLAVGMPVQEPEQASCLAVLEGLSTPTIALHGADTLQALIAALQHLAWELHTFVELGGRVLGLDDQELDPAAVFGGLWAPPREP
jgi:hypothetical protein